MQKIFLVVLIGLGVLAMAASVGQLVAVDAAIHAPTLTPTAATQPLDWVVKYFPLVGEYRSRNGAVQTAPFEGLIVNDTGQPVSWNSVRLDCEPTESILAGEGVVCYPAP